MNTFQLVTVLIIIQFKACCLMPLEKRSNDDDVAPSNSLQQAISSLNTLQLVLVGAYYKAEYAEMNFSLNF